MSYTYQADGHCQHAPKCIGVGEPDDRDPFGCCNCGTREAEQIPGTNARPTAGQRGGKDMNENPLYGSGRLSALANQQVTPKNGVEKHVSPTGEPIIPARLVPYIAFAAAALVIVRDSLDLPGQWPKLLGTLSSLLMLALGITPGWRRGTKVLALLLCLALPVLADAAPVRRAVLLEGLDAKAEHLVAVGAGEEAPMSPWSLFAVGPGVGIDIRAGKVSPVAELLGTLALTRVFGQVLSLGAGGSLLTGEELRTGFVAGLALDLPGPEGTLRPCLFVGGAYVEGGWGTRIALSFSSLLL